LFFAVAAEHSPNDAATKTFLFIAKLFVFKAFDSQSEQPLKAAKLFFPPF
jgi:hypothetical protein